MVGEDVLSRCDLPDLHRIVGPASAGRGDIPAVGRPCQSVDRVGGDATGCAIGRTASGPELSRWKNDCGALLALRGLFQRIREVLDAWVTLVWVLGERLQDHVLKLWRDRWLQ